MTALLVCAMALAPINQYRNPSNGLDADGALAHRPGPKSFEDFGARERKLRCQKFCHGDHGQQWGF
jgi:hypothetical protein